MSDLYNIKGEKIDLSLLNRLEVIDENGRSYVNWSEKNNIHLDFQDDNRTLKIFISRNK